MAAELEHPSNGDNAFLRCSVCGFVVEGEAPEQCPSCSAPQNRFQRLSSRDVSALIGDYVSGGIVSQDTDVTPIEDTRRIRLLAFVDQEFFAPYTVRSGPKYRVYTGDQAWFAYNIPCQTACPAHTDISRYLALIADGRYADSFALNRESNIFPGCLGRMCAAPCEDACRRQEIDKPIGIRLLKRVAADFRGETVREVPPEQNGKTVGIIGAGVAGLSTARELARNGYGITIYERWDVPGGTMWSGVPEWRLPRDVITEETQYITDLGVEIIYGVNVGVDITLHDLAAKHDAVVMAVGNQNPSELGIPGEDLPGVIGGIRFLEDVNFGQKEDVFVGKKVVTVGGGFTSMDCIRTVLRMGAEESTMTYRRSINEIPVAEFELEEALIEGCEIQYMVAPVEIIAGDDGHVCGIKLVKNELGPPDDSGRRRPQPIEGSEYIIECDQVIIAIGQYQDNDFLPEDMFPNRDRRGVPALNEIQQTEHSKIWAVGDYVTNPSNFISAIGGGKELAESIDFDLRGVEVPAKDFEITRVPIEDFQTPNPLVSEGVAEWSLSAMSRRLRWGDNYGELDRQEVPTLPLDERGVKWGSDETTLEAELGYSKPLGFNEAKRCLQCQLNIFIDGNRCILCNGCVDICPYECIEMISLDRIYSIDDEVELAGLARQELGTGAVAMIIDERACIRCGACVEWCPTECLTMEHYRPTNMSARMTSDLAIVADG